MEAAEELASATVSYEGMTSVMPHVVENASGFSPGGTLPKANSNFFRPASSALADASSCDFPIFNVLQHSVRIAHGIPLFSPRAQFVHSFSD